MSTNQQLAQMFQRMAEVLELTGANRFRVNAFQKAAQVLSEMQQDVADIGPDVKALQALEGVGEGTAKRIAEYLDSGRMQDYDELMAEVPDTLPALMNVPGVGPKTAAMLWQQAGIESVQQLKHRLDEDPESLKGLPNLGKKKLENIRKGLEFAEQAGKRVRISQAMPIALWFVEQLREMPGVQRVDYAGSLRRGKETIGDLDLLVAVDADHTESVMKTFREMSVVEEVLLSGSTKTSIRVRPESAAGQGIQADLRAVPPEQYGAALMYFTGSQAHNIRMRQRAIDRGMRLNEYGLTREDETVVAAASEQDVFAALDLPWIPPELREDRGEIKLAEQQALPELIRLEDIQAELHTHTTASDGTWSIRELAEAAIARGYHTLAVTDHSRSQVQANGLNADRLAEHIQAIHEVRDELQDRICLLAGSEVDILGDGRLDYPDSVLKELDFIVAGQHHALTQDGRDATKRLLAALEHPGVCVVGHPTGRLINRREGLRPDMQSLFNAAAEHQVALEINANAMRLDLRDTHARAAIEAGAVLSINTDAHGAADLEHLTYGVLTARRAGAEARQVINCWSCEDLLAWVAQRKG